MPLDCIILTMPIALSNKVDGWQRTHLTDAIIWKKIQETFKEIPEGYTINENTLRFENVGGSLYVIIIADKKQH